MAMTQDKANGLIVSALAISGTMAVIRAASDDAPGVDIRLPVGLTLAGVFLATAAQISPDLAGGVALLMITTSVLILGGPSLMAITGVVGGRGSSSSSGGGRGPGKVLVA